MLEALVLRGRDGYVCWMWGSLWDRGSDLPPSICWITDVVVGNSVTSPGVADTERLEDCALSARPPALTGVDTISEDTCGGGMRRIASVWRSETELEECMGEGVSLQSMYCAPSPSISRSA